MPPMPCQVCRVSTRAPAGETAARHFCQPLPFTLKNLFDFLFPYPAEPQAGDSPEDGEAERGGSSRADSPEG